jgi:two-component system sensor histidine kinase VicK
MKNTFATGLIPANEQQRLEALKRYKIIGTDAGKSFVSIAKILSDIFRVPIAIISLVDSEEVYFASSVGMNTIEGPRGESFCALTVLGQSVKVIEDALKDPVFRDHPLVRGDFSLRFYAGAPLVTPDGFNIGTVCIADNKPRSFTAEDKLILEEMAKMVMEQIELRLTNLLYLEKITGISDIKEQHLTKEAATVTQEFAGSNEELAAINVELLASQRDLQELTTKLEKKISERTHALKKNTVELETANEVLADAVGKQSAAQQEAIRQRNRLTGLFMQAPAGICILDGPDLVFELINPLYQQLFPGRALLGKALLEAIPEIKNAPIWDVLQGVYQTGKTFEGYELLIPLARTDEGLVEDRYFNFIYQARLNNDAFIDGLLVFVFEVTEQVNARKQVERAEENLKLATEAANLGYWYIEPYTKALTYNTTLAKLFGYEGEDSMTYEMAIGQVADEYRPALEVSINEAIKSGDKYDVTYAQRRFNDNELIWLRSVGKVATDASGKNTTFSGVVMDITEQKKDEQRKNDFIAMVSHELKTPLTSLSAYIQVLHIKAKEAEDNFTAGALEKAIKQVGKMTKMINGFLNVSRLESGKIHLEHRRFDMKELVEEIEDEIVPTTTSHHIIFDPVLTTWVNGDRDKIGQVITNFISNALKYSSPGTTVQIACVAFEGCCKLSVRDEGMGIASKDLSKLFDRYYRVVGHQMQTVAGFGIGLYLSAEIIVRHNGKIWVESEVGKGSIFYFSIPQID